jgi:hypothetical protein
MQQNVGGIDRQASNRERSYSWINSHIEKRERICTEIARLSHAAKGDRTDLDRYEYRGISLIRVSFET